MDWDHKTGFVIRDLATQFTRAFDNVFTATGADAIPTPAVAPNANAFAERWVRTVRRGLRNRTLIWNQRQLRRLLDEYLSSTTTRIARIAISTSKLPTTPNPPPWSN